jgi:hypothetical protein
LSSGSTSATVDVMVKHVYQKKIEMKKVKLLLPYLLINECECSIRFTCMFPLLGSPTKDAKSVDLFFKNV